MQTTNHQPNCFGQTTTVTFEVGDFVKVNGQVVQVFNVHNDCVQFTDEDGRQDWTVEQSCSPTSESFSDWS